MNEDKTDTVLPKRDVPSAIYSPVEGTVQELSTVSDQTFAEKLLGEGIAIVPMKGEIVSPVSGIITTVFHTGHAIGIIDEHGVEILIHIGVNTVKLEGQYFDAICKVDQKVAPGDLLVKFDNKAIQEAGYDSTVMIVVTNTNDYLSVLPEVVSGKISTKEKIITIVH